MSVVKSTDSPATKGLYRFVRKEWAVSVRVKIVGSSRRVGRVSQRKGGVLANASQKLSQIPVFYSQKQKKSNRMLFNIHVYAPNQNHPTPLRPNML